MTYLFICSFLCFSIGSYFSKSYVPFFTLSLIIYLFFILPPVLFYIFYLLIYFFTSFNLLSITCSNSWWIYFSSLASEVIISLTIFPFSWTNCLKATLLCIIYSFYCYNLALSSNYNDYILLVKSLSFWNWQLYTIFWVITLYNSPPIHPVWTTDT